MIRALLVFSLLLAPVAAQGADPAPPLVLEGLTVTPEKPRADTLCQLRVKVRNTSDRTITALAFTVTLAGQELAVYRNQLYLQAFPPGATTELRLYNFWTSETGRPAPQDGKLPIWVTLREAQFATVTKAENGDETWDLGDKVSGLPVTVETTLALVP
ncbi:MAG: hypothetical protein SF066_04010 [Thermoanaerobaculia bacterium]|nr:hypothetical protein [Thermoanaerobaculia bacterium]